MCLPGLDGFLDSLLVGKGHHENLIAIEILSDCDNQTGNSIDLPELQLIERKVRHVIYLALVVKLIVGKAEWYMLKRENRKSSNKLPGQ